MKQTLLIVELAISLCLMLVILLQQRGTTLGGAFGGEGSIYRSRRGVEKLLYWTTIVLAVLFGIIAVWVAIIS